MNFLRTLAARIAGTPPPTKPLPALAPRFEPANLGSAATAATISGAIRSAEAGETASLFRLYRDALLSDDMIQGCIGTRKLAVLAQPMAVMPFRRGHPDDLAAAAACERAVRDCGNWLDGLGAILDGTLWPVSVTEKIFTPAAAPESPREPALNWTLARFEPVNPQMFCFRHLFMGGGTDPAAAAAAPTWETRLRLWPVASTGAISYLPAQATRLDPERHIVHRGHLLTGMGDHWGGPLRCVLGWWLLRALGRDWFGRYMERYGSPFLKGKTNKADAGAVAFLQEAFSLSTRIGGIVIGTEDEVELVTAAGTGGPEGHKLWADVCNAAIQRSITGTDGSMSPAGLNAGQSAKSENVREDVRMFDQLKLAATLERQLFAPFLRINGLPGRVRVSFGGLSDADAKLFADTLATLSNAGFEPEDDALATMDQRLGFAVRRKAPAPMAGGFGFGAGFGNQEPRTNDQAPRTNTQAPSTKDQAPRPKNQAPEDDEEEDDDAPEPLPLSAPGMAQGLGVPPGWLRPVEEFLAELERKARDQSLTDADLLAFLDKAAQRVPELFGRMDVAELAKLLEGTLGEAVVSEVRRGLRKPGVTGE